MIVSYLESGANAKLVVFAHYCPIPVIGTTDNKNNIIMDPQTDNVVLFDGVCNLCNGLVRFIIKRDRKAIFKFASLQSGIGQACLTRFGLGKIEFESFVLMKEGKYFLKSDAALEILRELDGIWRACYVFRFVPRFIRDFFYDIVAKSRYQVFGKRDACIVPTPELERRFL